VRRIARVAAITAIAAVATVVLAAAPAYAGTFGTLNFGTAPVGSSSAPQSASIPLTTTVGAVRTQLAAAIDATTFTDINLVLVVVTADEQRRVAQDALARLADDQVLGYRIDTATLEHGTDFSLGGDCVGADGAIVAACTLTAVFTPTVDGQRVDGVDVGITLTVGVAAVVDALAACRCRILHPRSSEAW